MRIHIVSDLHLDFAGLPSVSVRASKSASAKQDAAGKISSRMVSVMLTRPNNLWSKSTEPMRASAISGPASEMTTRRVTQRASPTNHAPGAIPL